MARDGLDLLEFFDQIEIGPLFRGTGSGNYHLAPCDAYSKLLGPLQTNFPPHWYTAGPVPAADHISESMRPHRYGNYHVYIAEIHVQE